MGDLWDSALILRDSSISCCVVLDWSAIRGLLAGTRDFSVICETATERGFGVPVTRVRRTASRSFARPGAKKSDDWS
ncbi:hypothetical protein LBMAG48_28770 [Phycisphaerae bacterium]|nr:hypothetical protein LBMAG48_28770 [Phycisphaerae bacterium]